MTDLDVAIIGAGFAGIGMATALRKAGTRVRIFERADSIGGTWRDNTYPGIACDVPSHLYCFRDHPNPTWRARYASGSEIRMYLEHVVESEGLNGTIHLNTPLQRAQWCEEHWMLSSGESVVSAQSLILACGRLTQPRIPDIPGLETFPGPVMHTARWDHGLRLDGTRIAVVGTGASAVQLIPELVRQGADVVCFQRSPAWIVPRDDQGYSDAQRTHWAKSPHSMGRLRDQQMRDGEQRFASRSGDPTAVRRAQEAALQHLRRQVTDLRVRSMLTPRYPFGCKRVLLSDDFYPAVSSPEVTLEPNALVGINGTQLFGSSGRRHSVDILVFATGYETTRQPYAHLIEGEYGQTLADHWSTGMTSLGSTLVAGFPDMYILNGPNASLGHNSSILMLEEQYEFVRRCLDERQEPVRARERSERAFTEEIVRRSAGTAWLEPGCSNWYVDERSGRLTLLWPGSVASFHERLGLIGPDDFEPSRRTVAALTL